MREMILQQSCPVFVEEIEKNETTLVSVDEIIGYLKVKIDENPNVAYIAEFDHFAHTSALENGEVSPDILAAKNLIFCFGPKIPSPYMMALKPRSMGISETKKGFVITFLEAPMPMATKTMISWAESIKNK